MRWSAVALVAATMGLSVLNGTPAAAASADCEYYFGHCRRGFVVPCSLDGVNPAYHPSIFGNPAVARAEYGFIRSRDGSWQVERGCVRGPYHGG